jgi:putative oxidoreductase
MSTLEKFTELSGRILIAAIFLLSGLNKIGTFANTQGFMESAGVPGALLPLVILIEVAGALAVIVGWQTRYAALILAAFCVLAGVLFHSDFSDPMQKILLLKNLAIAGGFLLLSVRGAGELSLDARISGGEKYQSESY